MNKRFALLLALTTVFFSGHLLAQTLNANDPWIPEAPPTARMLAGYMQLHNSGAEAVRLVDARSELFGRVEIHRSETVDGMSRMRRIKTLEIPAGESVLLERGGLHLMLMAPERVPASGERVSIDLIDETGQVALTIEAEVRPRPGQD